MFGTPLSKSCLTTFQDRHGMTFKFLYAMIFFVIALDMVMYNGCLMHIT